MAETSTVAEKTDTMISLRPRYARLAVDEGIELAERNYHYKHLDWRVPIRDCALICLDVWNYHYSVDTLERVEDITRNRIAPLVAACREHGLQVIHGPASPVVEKSPNWIKLLNLSERQPEWPNSPQWPPPEFRRRTGDYAQFARPVEWHHEYCFNYHPFNLRDFHETVRPEGDEAVILNGEELHRLCAQRGILHLFYVGFNTNACMIYRDYGIKDMIARGYHGILLRDCTTGMELADTVADLTCTRGMIATLEQFGAYSMESGELIEALKQKA